MSLPERLAWGAGFGTVGAGNSFPMNPTTDNTNFPGLGFTPITPGTFRLIPPGSVIPIDRARLMAPSATNPNVFYEEYKKATEPDIPMAPPTNRRRIKLRD